MKPYQKDFIEFAIRDQVLKFGEFHLKSGRISPYFFNAGLFTDGNAFYELSKFYANVIQENFHNQYDVIFGPAYKGISLATSASIGLKTYFDQNVPVSFNRKEIKDHGEGGKIIGSNLCGKRTLLIDDVITAGTTLRESHELIHSLSGNLVGAVIALDRQEKGVDTALTAIQEIEQHFNLKISSIITLRDLISYLHSHSEYQAQLKSITTYQAQYGTNIL